MGGIQNTIAIPIYRVLLYPVISKNVLSYTHMYIQPVIFLTITIALSDDLQMV